MASGGGGDFRNERSGSLTDTKSGLKKGPLKKAGAVRPGLFSPMERKPLTGRMSSDADEKGQTGEEHPARGGKRYRGRRLVELTRKIHAFKSDVSVFLIRGNREHDLVGIVQIGKRR